jgi:hypothetical protein
MVLYPNSPGTVIQELPVTSEAITGGIKTAVMLGETDLAFKGAPDFQTPVFISDLAALSAKYDQDGAGVAGVNMLYEQAYRHFMTGGGPLYLCQAGPVGTFLTTPECISDDLNTVTTGGTLLRSIKWHIRVTEYVTNALVTKGETLASEVDANITTGGTTDTNEIVVAHTMDADADGWRVYMQADGENTWYLAADTAEATATITATPTVAADLPTRNEGLVSQVAADIDDWQTALDNVKGLNFVHVVCIAGGLADRDDNIDLMDAISDHCEATYADTYIKRIGVCPAIAAETHAERINTTDYTNTSDRLVKVAFGGTEGYVCGAMCSRNFDESITFFALPTALPEECYQGGTSYPLSKAERDVEYGLGWVILKPFEEGVRITKGITAQAGAEDPTVFKELFVRTLIDNLIENLERQGDAFIGSGRAINNQNSRMRLQATYVGILNNLKSSSAIDDYSIVVVPNAEGDLNAVDVAFSVDVGHEINKIFGYMTVGG